MIYVLGKGHIVYQDGIIDPNKIKCVVVDKLPILEEIEGKIAVIVPNFETNTVSWEYEDIKQEIVELTDKERIEQLESVVASLIPQILGGANNG